MALSTPFTCPNGHSFTANAKLRARCPECGTMARKSFGSIKDPKPEPHEEPETDPQENPPKEPVKESKPQIKVLRQGRTREKKAPVRMARPKEKPVARKPVITGGIIKKKRLVKSEIPNVRAKPHGNREHKVAATIGKDKPYWHQVAEKYWR